MLISSYVSMGIAKIGLEFAGVTLMISDAIYEMVDSMIIRAEDNVVFRAS